MPIKYIFVTGGVLSSLGKGITAASIGSILEDRGLKIALLKLDPYLNVDPGTMNPFQHGEVYVTDDGAETDLDLGHYYRFTKSPLSKASNATSGQIYDTVIKAERKGDFLGQTVQVIPHVTDEIKKRILACANQEKGIQVVFVEIGGTVGDIEALPIFEAIRQFRYERPHDCLNIHLTYVPFIKSAGEVKTKPSQHSVQALREIGIIPDFILCRCEQPLDPAIKDKISLFCHVPKEAVIDEPDVTSSIYEVPLYLKRQKIDDKILSRLDLSAPQGELEEWKKIIHILSHPKKKVVIGVVGKYIDHQDAYKSVFESLVHGAIAHEADLEIRKFEASKVQGPHDDIEPMIKGCDGYLVPGGFGERGWLGKLLTAKYCREKKIPYFGLCLGMQILVVEFARNVVHLTNAHSTEVDPTTPNPVISMLSEQKGLKDLGGTMRLGAYPCKILPGTKAHSAYQKDLVKERHRHRYEFNNLYKRACEEKGLVISGVWEEGNLAEIVEVKDHPWMLGTQFHPEFKSRPFAPHPLFAAFIKAAIDRRDKKHG